MKKGFYILTIAALSFTLTACSQNSQTSSSSGTSTSEVSSNKVTYYDSDGETVLKTAKVKTTEEVLEYTPTKDGKTFVGWFIKPDYSRKFTDSSELTSNLSLYAGFSTYEEDTRQFIVVGNGDSDVLKASNWGATFENSGGLGETSSKRSNIKVAKAGTYTFTLTTHPAEDIYDTESSEYTDENKESFNINNFDTITWTFEE